MWENVNINTNTFIQNSTCVRYCLYPSAYQEIFFLKPWSRLTHVCSQLHWEKVFPRNKNDERKREPLRNKRKNNCCDKTTKRECPWSGVYLITLCIEHITWLRAQISTQTAFLSGRMMKFVKCTRVFFVFGFFYWGSTIQWASFLKIRLRRLHFWPQTFHIENRWSCMYSTVMIIIKNYHSL